MVVKGNAKRSMLTAMKQGIEHEKVGQGLLPDSARLISGAEYTLKIMEQAPIIILILNPLQQKLELPMDEEAWFFHCANQQSIGAAIQNMHLAATSMGLGSLWICDVFFAYRELCDWLKTEDQLAAAVALGYPGERPYPRPRKKLEHITQWME